MATIKEDIAVLKEQVGEMRMNHLPHINTRLDAIENRQWWTLGTLIIGILVSIFLKLI